MRPWPFPKPQAAPSAPRPMPGSAGRLIANSVGFTYSGVTVNGKYPHPFRPSLSGSRISFMRGLINETWEPTIKGVPIGGKQGASAPTLTLDAGIVDLNGQCWCCVEAEPDDSGELTAKSRVEIVQSIVPRSLDPKIGRKAVVQVLWRNGKPYRAFEIVYFNLDYTRIIPAPGNGAVRHLFL